MTKLFFSALCSALLLLALGACAKDAPKDPPPTTPDVPEQEQEKVDPKEVHASAILIDTHIDTPYRLSHETVDISQRLSDGHFDFVRAKEGGLDASFFAVYVSSKFNKKGTAPKAEGGAYAEANRIIDLIEKEVAARPKHAELAKSPDDIERVAKAGKHAVLMGMENGAPVEGDLEKLRALNDRGIRYITLTHSKDNHISDSSYDERGTHGGLSDFGKKVVAEMNRLGMLIDISHVSDAAFMQVLKLSKTPVIATHSSLRKFRGWQRNVSDDMLKALAKNGGVLHINFGSVFLTDACAEAFKARNKKIDALLEKEGKSKVEHASELPAALRKKTEKIRAEYADKNATLADVVEHIDYAAKLVGVDHVGIGSDYDGVMDVPTGLEDVSKYPAITEALLERGYSREDIHKIYGGNLLRAWRENLKRVAAAAGVD